MDETAAIARPAVADIRTLRLHLLGQGRGTLLHELHQPHPALAVWRVVQSWGLVFAAWAVCFYGSALLLPLALLVVGSRQRALGNALHDAGHGNMVAGRRANRRVASALFALPMFEDYEQYRLDHLRHHAYLGDPRRDPDYLETPREADGQPVQSPWRFYLRFLLDGRLWRKSALGDLPRMSALQRAKVVGWWAALLGVLTVVAELPATLAFAGLWLLARVTTYHAIKMFAEVSDHVGLEPGSILGYTRNLPDNWFSFFLHPHHDNYHLAHHLFPRIPLANLQQLHQLLMQTAEYGSAHHCQSYFWGPSAVVRSWVQPFGLPHDPAAALLAPIHPRR